MDLSYEQQTYGQRGTSPRRLIGIGAVVVLHLFIGYALVSGLARSALQIVKKPLEAKIVQEILPPPPPPTAPPTPARADIGVACPTQVKPQVPRKALQEGTSGVVKEVTILSGPTIYHQAVRAAMLQYRCVSGSGEIRATQQFDFKVD